MNKILTGLNRDWDWWTQKISNLSDKGILFGIILTVLIFLFPKSFLVLMGVLIGWRCWYWFR